MTAQAESSGRSAGRRKGRAGEHGVPGIRAEPSLDVGRHRPDLRRDVSLEIIEPAQRDRDAPGLARLVVRDQEIKPAAKEVAARGGQRTERDAGAGAVARAKREGRRRVIVLILQDDELVRPDVGRRFDPQTGSGVDLNVVTVDVRASRTGSGQPKLSFLDGGAARIRLRRGEPEDAGSSSDKSAVCDVSGNKADRASARSGGASVQTNVSGLPAEIQGVDQGDGVGGVSSVEGEDARIEEWRPPDDSGTCSAEIDVDGRPISAEAGAGATHETDLTGAGAKRTGEIPVGLIGGLLGLGAGEDEVGRG